MAIFNKGALANFFGLADEEEYEYSEKTKPRPEVVQQAPQMRQQAQPMRQQSNVKTQSKEFVRPEARPVNPSTNGGQQQPFRSSKSVQPNKQEEKKVVSMRQNGAGSNAQATAPKQSNKITIVEPRVYSEAMTIAKRLIASESVLVNFHLIEEGQARRIVDFLTGTVYALDGDIKRVGDEIFLCTPANVEIDNSTAQSIAQSQFFDF
ncbi:cell division protein [Enterococcus sp. JM4C]|uniref:cell division protein SepF n=1 Tax=Candidatus Enterococcus huntleyi TaxID=1857217 RepID=UPI00137ADB15|nr:cell division protein SepF [Enterococcus sp. JM4C]KAF1297155.1 cell division protein [Enterococcus sp. JM4C]